MSPSSPVVSTVYRRIFLLSIVLITLLIFILIFPLIDDLLVVLIISIVLTYVFKPGVTYLEHYGVHPVVSIASIFVLGGALIGAGLYFFVPLLVDEAVALIDQLKGVDFVELYASFVTWVEGRMPGLSARLGMTPDQASAWVEQIGKVGATLFQQSHKVIAGAVNIIILATIVPFMTFFLLRDGSTFTRKFIEKVPNRYFEMTLSLAYRVDHQFGNYIRSVLLESLVIAVMTWLALEILGVRFAVVLGLLNGLLNSIPYFGPFIAYFPICLVVLLTFDPPLLGLSWTVIILIVVQIFDNFAAKPVLISRSVKVHPVVVLLAVLVGGRLAGAIGMFIAVPVYAVVQAVIIDSYTHLKRYRIF